MATPYFVAGAASVTVMRSVASTAFGQYTLKVPEGVNLEDVYELSAPGNELGYVASLGGGRVGGMMRRFKTEKVEVTAADASDPDWVPMSNVDQVLLDAEKQVSGDFFLESDITKAGLGPWVPFVDFQVGDKANVEIWGMVVPMSVSRIEPIRSDHSVVDWKVHVGGQILTNEDERLAANEEIHRALLEDRRDLAGLETRVSKAQSTADSAQTTANSAAESAEVNRQTLLELTPQVSDATKIANQAYLDVSTLTPKVTEASNQATLAFDSVTALTPKVSAAQADASSAIEKANTTAQTLSSYQSSTDQKLADANSKATSALSDSAKAISWLENPTDVGTSLVTMLPGTTTPAWAEGARVNIIPAPNSLGTTVYGSPTDAPNSHVTRGGYVTVDPRLEYVVELWWYTAAAGARTVIELRDNSGATALESSLATTDSQLDNANSNYLWWTPAGASVGWHRVKLVAKFKPGVSLAKIGTVYWNHSGGSVGWTHITDLKIAPRIPTQAAVDLAQNTAINANTTALAAQRVLNEKQDAWNKAVTDSLAAQATLNANQGAWNKAVDDSFAAQSTLNANQAKWNQAVTDAQAAQATLNAKQDAWNKAATDSIEANRKAILALGAPQVGNNVLPLVPGETKGAWTAQADSSTSVVIDGNQSATGYNFGSTKNAVHTNTVAVDPSIEYDFTIWMKGTNNSVIYIGLVDQNGQLAVESGAISSVSAASTDGGWGTVTARSTGYIVNNCVLPATMSGFTTRVKLKPGVRYVRVGTIYASHPNGPAGVATIADMRMTPHQVDQAKIDLMQDTQITENSKRVGEITELQRQYQLQLDRIKQLQDDLLVKTVGKITVKGGWKARSGKHQIGVRMPYNDRDLYLYAHPDFNGSITSQVFYSNGDAYQFIVDSSDMTTSLSSTLNWSYFQPLVNTDGNYKWYKIFVPLGNIDSATILVDQIQWDRTSS